MPWQSRWNTVRETEITAADVEREHLEEVHQRAHWAYMTLVIALGLIAMLLLIAFLGTQTA